MASGANTIINQRKVVCADFCQGDERFSSCSRGRKCMTNSITFIMKSYLKRIEDTDTQDMYTILLSGDILYRKLYSERQQHDLLNFQDLPELIEYNSRCFTIRGQKTYVGTMCREGGVDGLGLPLESSLNQVTCMTRTDVPVLLIFPFCCNCSEVFQRNWCILCL